MQGHQAIASIVGARSVAVVGASADPEKWGHQTVKTILEGGYDGKLYAINPKGADVLGVPGYRSVSAVPGDLDLVFIVIPAQFVPDVLAESAAKGVRAVALASAGYRESGHLDREQALVRQIGELGMRLLGPNIQGFIYTPNKLSAMFWPFVRVQGPIALISSSGSLSAAFGEWAVADGVGVSGIINLGNRVDLDECDMLEFFGDDPNTRAIALYLEGVREGRRFLETARRVARIKPVVILKSGRSAAGQRSAASHTGSLAGVDAVFSAACRQYGLVRVDDLETLLDAGKALAADRPPRGKRVLVVTTSGGGATLACDEAEKHGLEIPTLPPALVEELSRLDLHHNVNLSNPLDLAGITASHFEQALAVVDRYDVADTYLVVFADPVPDSTGCVQRIAARTQRSVAVAYLGGGETERVSSLEIQACGIPVFRAAERASRGIAAAVDYHRSTLSLGGALAGGDGPHASPRPADHDLGSVSPSGAVSEPDAIRLLSRYGIPYPEHGLAHSPGEAAGIAERIGYPVVLKVVSPDVLHKSDAGGVVTGLGSAEEVRQGYERMAARVLAHTPGARIDGVLVCRQAPEGLEVIAGAVQDPVFGPTVMFGLGGVFAEVLRDVSFRLVPLTEADARDLVREIHGYPLIAGVRGQAPCDEDALVRLLVALSQLVSDSPNIVELDINPVRLYPHGLLALDARILIDPKAAPQSHDR